MLGRRLAISIAVLIAVLPASESFAAESPERSSHRALEQNATRADVLAGNASKEQRLGMLRASVEAAGGVVVEESEDPTASAGFALGGYAYPLLVSDLNGDGDDEVLLQQHVKRNYVVAIDDGDLAWREQLPPKSYLVGAIKGDLFAEDGTEVLLVLYKWNTDKTILGGVDENGLRWSAPLDVDYSELNGLVEADTDPQAEIAVTVWSDNGTITVRTLDGETGTLLSELRSTTDQLDLGAADQAFVTDGPEGQSDEAVFLTPLLGGYYAERLSLADGSRRTLNVFPGEEIPTIYQGVDYTGDGRRDGYISDFIFSEDETITRTMGVFDAAALESAWTQTSEEDFFSFFFYPPYQAGDADGDGGQDLCVQKRVYDYDGDIETSSAEIRCLAGATGAQLWSDVGTASGEYAYATVLTGSDLDANGVIDPVIVAEAYSCSDDDYFCTTDHFEATALNGSNGAPIWSTDNWEDSAGIWGITGSNLDGVAGDDTLGYEYNESEFGAPFVIHNGLTRMKAWEGVVDTGTAFGYVDSAIAADMDGDGTLEAVLTSGAYEPIGEPTCEVWEGEEYCWYEDYEEYAFATAFDSSGTFRWQLEL